MDARSSNFNATDHAWDPHPRHEDKAAKLRLGAWQIIAAGMQNLAFVLSSESGSLCRCGGIAALQGIDMISQDKVDIENRRLWGELKGSTRNLLNLGRW